MGSIWCIAYPRRGAAHSHYLPVGENDIVDKSIGFSRGDDYVTKPFDATELILRIEAHIRRHKDTIDFASLHDPRRIGDYRRLRCAFRRVPGACARCS